MDVFEGVLAQDYAAGEMEILVVDGMSVDGTREVVEALRRRDPRLRLLDNPERIVSTALNRAIREARGDILVRVDGHCEIAADYVSRCVDHLENDDVDGVGGAIDTVGEGRVARAIAAAMSSAFGVGGSAFRMPQRRSHLADTIPFPAYLRRAVAQAGPFDEELVRNQDDEYNYRLRKAGARLLLAEDVVSRYYSRASFRSLFRQYFQYGFWKVRVLQKHPRQMSTRQFVPPALIAGWGATLAGAPAFGWWPFLSLTAVYALLTVAMAVPVAARAGWDLLPLLPACFATLHVSYGAGFLTGLVRFRDRWRDPAGSTGVAAQWVSEEGAW